MMDADTTNDLGVDITPHNPCSLTTFKDVNDEITSSPLEKISKTKKRKNKRYKRELRLGTWNFQGTGQALKLEHLVHDLARYKVDICGLQETRKSLTYTQVLGDYHLVFLEHDTKGYLGLGFAIHKRLWTSAYRYQIHTSRIAQIDLHMGNYCLSCLTTNASTLQKSEDDTTLHAKYYEELSSITRKIPKRNDMFILGDFNVKIAPSLPKHTTNIKENHTSTTIYKT
jgi:exonuclease III